MYKLYRTLSNKFRIQIKNRIVGRDKETEISFSKYGSEYLSIGIKTSDEVR